MGKDKTPHGENKTLHDEKASAAWRKQNAAWRKGTRYMAESQTPHDEKVKAVAPRAVRGGTQKMGKLQDRADLINRPCYVTILSVLG